MAIESPIPFVSIPWAVSVSPHPVAHRDTSHALNLLVLIIDPVGGVRRTMPNVGCFSAIGPKQAFANGPIQVPVVLRAWIGIIENSRHPNVTRTRCDDIAASQHIA